MYLRLRQQILLSFLEMKVKQLKQTQLLLSTLRLQTMDVRYNALDQQILSHNSLASCLHVPPKVEGEKVKLTPQQKYSQNQFKLKSSIIPFAQNGEISAKIKTNSLNLPNLSMNINRISKICSVESVAKFKQTFMLSSVCQKRFYSKNVIDDGSRNVEHNDESEDNEVSKKNDSLHNDPWVKSLLSDMKRDFDMQQKDTVYEIDDTNEQAEDQNNVDKTSNDNVDKMSSGNVDKIKNNSDDVDVEYEYDYRYAGDDDIEEFGYFDEGDIADGAEPKRNLPISLHRGVSGVFELEEVMRLMEHLGCTNIVSVPIPVEANYCDHMVIVTAKSRRHLQAVNEEMLWVHKRKKSKKDPGLHIEGKDKSEWCAMDIGNVVLHVFLNEQRRQYYDIESLWLLGPDEDPKCQLSQDDFSFALSPEELYWLEVEGTKTPPPTPDDGHHRATEKQT